MAPPASHVAVMGRPVIVFTDEHWERIYDLCQILCTGEEIASIMKVSYDTLTRRVEEKHGVTFAEFYKTATDGGKASLRRSQYRLAVDELNPTMLIWLGKQHLGQTDSVDMTHHFPRPTVIKRVDGTEVVLGAIEGDDENNL